MKDTFKKYMRLSDFALREWPALVIIFVVTLASTATIVLQPWPLKILVDYALGDSAIPASLQALLDFLSLESSSVLLVVLAAISSLLLLVSNAALNAFLTLVWAKSGQRMVYDLAAHLYSQLQKLSLLFHSRRTVGDSLSRLTDDTWCIYTVTAGLLVAPAQHIFTIVTIGFVAWSLDPEIMALSLIVAPVMVVTSYFFGNRIKRQTHQLREAESRLMAFVQQTISSILMIQAFASETRNRNYFQSLSNDIVTGTQRNVVLNNTHALVNGVSMTVGVAIVLYFGGQRVLAGALSVGSLIVFVAYMRNLHSSMMGLLSTYISLKRSEAEIDRVLEVLDNKEYIEDQPGARSLSMQHSAGHGHISFENVTFGYENGQAVLKGISLEAEAGKSVAIIGATGAGKSTLVSLVPRFFDPWEGQVTLDGVNIKNFSLTSLRQQISIVLQDPFLLPMSIAENIAYSRPGAGRDEIVASAVKANADDFIRTLPEGYDTLLGERGATLSGGERQRLAIARAILKDAPILILDEPTSSLDTKTEALIFEALQRLMKGRTTIIIAHRLSTIHQADSIVVLKGGEIVETGNHSELMAMRGEYYRLYFSQFSPAKEVGGNE